MPRSGMDTYRVADSSASYTFEFCEFDDGTWRAYIVSQPSYGSRPQGIHDTHRLKDERGHYVCWTHPLTTLRDAKRIAAAWAEHTQDYIRTGDGFE